MSHRLDNASLVGLVRVRDLGGLLRLARFWSQHLPASGRKGGPSFQTVLSQAAPALLRMTGLDGAKGLVLSLSHPQQKNLPFPLAPALWGWLRDPQALELGLQWVSQLTQSSLVQQGAGSFSFYLLEAGKGRYSVAIVQQGKLFMATVLVASLPSLWHILSPGELWSLLSSRASLVMQRFLLSSRPLSRSSDFEGARKHFSPSQLFLFVRPGLLLRRFLPPSLRGQLRSWMARIQDYGLGLQLSKNALVLRDLLGFRGEGHPLLRLLEPIQPPLNLAALVPADVYCFGSATFQVPRLQQVALNLARALRLPSSQIQKGLQTVDNVKEMIRQRFQLDLDRDVLSKFTCHYATLLLGPLGRKFPLLQTAKGMALLLRLRRDHRFSRLLQKVMGLLVAFSIPVRQEIIDRHRVYAIQLPGKIRLWLTLHQSLLVVAGARTTLERLLRHWNQPKATSLFQRLPPGSALRQALARGKNGLYLRLRPLRPLIQRWPITDRDLQALRGIFLFLKTLTATSEHQRQVFAVTYRARWSLPRPRAASRLALPPSSSSPANTRPPSSQPLRPLSPGLSSLAGVFGALTLLPAFSPSLVVLGIIGFATDRTTASKQAPSPQTP